MMTTWRVMVVLAAAGCTAVEAQSLFPAKNGPGGMRVADAAVLKIPAGYSYTEAPVNFAAEKQKASASATVVILGTVWTPSNQIVTVGYLPNPEGAAFVQGIYRTLAFFNIDTFANRHARNSGTEGLFAGKVLESDRYDPRTATLRYQVGLSVAGDPTSQVIARHKVYALFARHGEIFLQLGLAEGLPAIHDREFQAFMNGIEFLPGEAPAWYSRVGLPSSRELAGSWPSALAGLVVGIAWALVSRRQAPRAAAMEPVAAKVRASAGGA